MLDSVKNHFGRCWKEYASAAAVLLLITMVLVWGYGLWEKDLTYPLQYEGGDDMSMLVDAKLLQQQTWTFTTDRLGAPNGITFTDFSANLLNNVGKVILKIFVMITQNIALAANLTYLSAFLFAGLISYFVMRDLHISNWIAVLTSAAFGCAPYLVLRGISHIVLTECYFVPLSILLCIWVYERDDILCMNKQFFKNPRNYLAVFFTLLIANNGIAYYPFFTCYLLIVTAISKAAKTKKWKYGAKAGILIVCICVFLVLSLLPGKIYSWQYGSNKNAIERNFAETELYGLKIIQLFLPAQSHGSEFLENLLDNYNETTWFLNENSTAYIGLIGIVGFVILMLVLFMKKNSKTTERLGFLSELNLMMVLLGTSSGFGTMFAFLISPMLRAYTRISIFICYVCILAFALAADSFYQKCMQNKKQKRIAYAFAGGVTLFALFGIWEGFPTIYVFDDEEIVVEYSSDRDFVAQIEGMVEEGAKIYQLPYHLYPEGGFEYQMMDYDLYTGFIHSDTLKWSYASVKGRAGDEWNYNISQLPLADMVAQLKQEDFSGIYIDRRAYEEEAYQELERSLADITGHTAIVSDNGNLSFFKF